MPVDCSLGRVEQLEAKLSEMRSRLKRLADEWSDIGADAVNDPFVRGAHYAYKRAADELNLELNKGGK